MKIKFFLPFIPFIMVTPLSSQSLVKENRLWSNSSFGTEKWNYWTDTHWIKFESDMTINDTTYKVIWRSDDENRENWYQQGYIREDTSKKIFLRQKNREFLLYDFNLEVGDSILSNQWNEYVYVIQVDSVVFGVFNDLHKRIILGFVRNDDPEDGYPWPWIEGIGSLQGILSGAENVGICCVVHNLVCFSENDTLKYMDDYHGSCFPQGYYEGMEGNIAPETNVKVVHQGELISFIFNNPNNSNIHISIYDISGRSFGVYNVAGSDRLDIPRSRFSPGIYVYQCRYEDQFKSNKFVVK